MSDLEKEAYELYRTIWSKKLDKEEPHLLPEEPVSPQPRRRNPKIKPHRLYTKAG